MVHPGGRSGLQVLRLNPGDLQGGGPADYRPHVQRLLQEGTAGAGVKCDEAESTQPVIHSSYPHPNLTYLVF